MFVIKKQKMVWIWFCVVILLMGILIVQHNRGVTQEEYSFNADQELAKIYLMAGERGDHAEYLRKNLGALLERGGVDGAMEVMKGALQRDLVTIGDCHSLVHLIGHQAYQLARKNVKGLGRADAKLCGSAYQHGIEAEITERVVDPKIAIQELRSFCLEMRKAIGESDCYHGVGHGMMKVSKDISHSLRFCDLLIEPTSHDLSECYKGVFSETAFMLSGVDSDTGLPIKGGPTLTLPYDHPLDLCASLSYSYQQDCGLQLSRLLSEENSQDDTFSKCLDKKYVQELQEACIQVNAAVFTQHTLSRDGVAQPSHVILSLGQGYREAYIRGAAGEFRAFFDSHAPKDWNAFCGYFVSAGDKAFCSNTFSNSPAGL